MTRKKANGNTDISQSPKLRRDIEQLLTRLNVEGVTEEDIQNLLNAAPPKKPKLERMLDELTETSRKTLTKVERIESKQLSTDRRLDGMATQLSVTRAVIMGLRDFAIAQGNQGALAAALARRLEELDV